MLIGAGMAVYVADGASDMRKSIDGLAAAIVADCRPMDLAAALARNAALEAANETLKATVATLTAKLEAVQFQLAQLQRLVFGHKAERLVIDAHTGLLFEVASPPAPEPQTRTATVLPKAKPVRETLPAHLPREVILLDLPEAEKPCPCCGEKRHVIGEVVSEKLDKPERAQDATVVAVPSAARDSAKPNTTCRPP